MTDPRLQTYTFLSARRWPRSYTGKVALVCIVTGSLPALAVAAYLIVGSPESARPTGNILAVVLGATIAGLAIMIYLLHGLLQPVHATARALKEYLNTAALPRLGSRHQDAVGQLMADVQYTVERLDDSIRELEHIAQTDVLTRTYNRFAAEKRLHEDLARNRREHGILIVARVEIDGFADINARLGRRISDQCLKHVVDTITDNTRAGDWLARWGDAELLLGLWGPGGPEPEAEEILRRILDELSARPVTSSGGEPLHLTLSIGAVRCSADMEPAQLIEQTVDAMKKARSGGGNRMTIQ